MDTESTMTSPDTAELLIHPLDLPGHTAASFKKEQKFMLPLIRQTSNSDEFAMQPEFQAERQRRSFGSQDLIIQSRRRNAISSAVPIKQSKPVDIPTWHSTSTVADDGTVRPATCPDHLKPNYYRKRDEFTVGSMPEPPVPWPWRSSPEYETPVEERVTSFANNLVNEEDDTLFHIDDLFILHTR